MFKQYNYSTHYDYWKNENLEYLNDIYSIFYYHFKDLYVLNKDSKDRFFRLIYDRY